MYQSVTVQYTKEVYLSRTQYTYRSNINGRVQHCPKTRWKTQQDMRICQEVIRNALTNLYSEMPRIIRPSDGACRRLIDRRGIHITKNISLTTLPRPTTPPLSSGDWIGKLVCKQCAIPRDFLPDVDRDLSCNNLMLLSATNPQLISSITLQVVDDLRV